MTIPYNLNIPFSTHNPSVDQPNMEINTNNIASIIAIDHVAFNTAGSGQHNQVTFNANNVPGGFSPPVFYTNNDAFSIPQLFYATQDAAHSTNQYVAMASGSVLVLGGIIIKWGGAGTIGTPVNFTPAFPNNCFSVQITGTSSLYSGGFVVTAKSKTTFTVARTDGHSGATGYSYLAIGN